MTDKIKIENLRNRREGSLETLISQYGKYVSAVIFKVSGGYFAKEDVEEMAADIFVALWKNAEKIDEERDIRQWLAKAARNRTISRFRKEHHSVEREAFPLQDDSMIFEKDSTDELALRREMAEVLNTAVGKLKKTEQEIFTRFYFYNEKITAIAERLQMNPATVKTSLHRSRKKLQAEFEERGYKYEG